MTVRVRSLDDRIIALYGPARPMPNTLQLNGEMTMRVNGFTVGMRDYHGDFEIVATDRERSWKVVSRREPSWVLPLVTEHLIRTPLRRPFQGNGALLRIGVRDSAGAPTILEREVHLEVQESALLRFIARLGAMAINDYAGDVEKEEMAFLHEVLTALLADISR